MTITEQLQFSVLTAPVASIDRRSLSQAWYSALYGNSNATAQPKAIPAETAQAHRHSSTHANSERRADEPRGLARTGLQAKVSTSVVATLERRAPKSALARKIARTFRTPRYTPQKASFTVDSEQGRVHILLQTRGSQLKLIAICPPKARAHVAEALAQARYAMAARGVELDAVAREDAAC